MILNHRIFLITAFLPLYVNAMHWYARVIKYQDYRDMYLIRYIHIDPLVQIQLKYEQMLKKPTKYSETLDLLLSLSWQEKEGTNFMEKMPPHLIFELCKFLNIKD